MNNWLHVLPWNLTHWWTMSQIVIILALLLILCLFFFKEHINVCAKYLVECPNACGEIIPREKVRCSVLDPSDWGGRGGGGVTVYTGDTRLMENIYKLLDAVKFDMKNYADWIIHITRKHNSIIITVLLIIRNTLKLNMYFLVFRGNCRIWRDAFF